MLTHLIDNLASNTDLASLKVEVDKTDVNKLKIVLADLSKLSNVVDDHVVKKLPMIN